MHNSPDQTLTQLLVNILNGALNAPGLGTDQACK